MDEVVKKLFPGFEPGLVKEISGHARLRKINAGEILMKTGQYFRTTILVISGLVKVFQDDEDGNEYFMYDLQPGRCIEYYAKWPG